MIISFNYKVLEFWRSLIIGDIGIDSKGWACEKFVRVESLERNRFGMMLVS